MATTRFFIFLCTLLLAACSVPDGTLIHSCANGPVMRAVCGMQSPEDIAVVPGGDYLLLSELGSMGAYPGRLLLFNVNDESFQSIYSPAKQTAPAKLLGDPRCTTPPSEQMSPHGTHLLTMEDGSVRYLVVNHGGREAVELFSVENNEEGVPHLHWQGCVLPEDNTLINDVVGLANGDVVYSRMFRPDDFASQQRALLFAADTGDVWRWNQQRGLRVLPSTEGSLTNGLEISADERYLFINQYMNKEVHKYDLVEEKLSGVAAIANADNSAWGPDGELWLATHTADPLPFFTCYLQPRITCGMAFEIIGLNPDTMTSRLVFKHQGPPMGAATVARFNRDKVYFGSFLGDRLAIVPLSEFD